MADTAAVARPYARAVFELARDGGDFAHWSDMLAFATAVAHDPTMLALIHSPRVDAKQLARLFIDVCADRLDNEGTNFIRLLTQNDRLAALPDIAELYESLRAEAEGFIEAELISAAEVSHEKQQKIVEALERRLNRTVKLDCKIDTTLLGGAIIRAGDMVIDGSFKSGLQKLAVALAR